MNPARALGQALATAHDATTSAAYAGAGAALAAITIAYSYEVVARYGFNAPTTWASDYVSYFLCASVFLALPYVTRHGEHIAITYVVDHARAAGFRTALLRFINLCALGVCALATWMSIGENLRQMATGTMTLGANPIPQWWLSIFITYGFGSSALHFLRFLHRPPDAGGHGGGS